MTIPIDDVCTEQDLADELGSREKLRNLLADELALDGAEAYREQALRDVLKALSNLVPPVREADLADVSELKESVATGAIWRLYLHSVTTEGDVHHLQYRHWYKRHQDEVTSLKPTTQSQAQISTFSIATSRR